jgi:hypothetical protein
LFVANSLDFYGTRYGCQPYLIFSLAGLVPQGRSLETPRKWSQIKSPELTKA